MNVEKMIYEHLFRTGEFENERIGVTVSVDVTENPIEVYKDVKALVFSMHEEGKLIEESKKVAEAPTPKKLSYNLAKIETTNEEGPSGPYKKAAEQSGEDYRNLIEDLKQHDGKLTRDGMFIWLFSDSKTVGMKPSRK